MAIKILNQDMKKHDEFGKLILATLAAGFFLFAGCASTPADRAVSMSKNVVQTGQDLESSRAAVTQALTTLNQMITQPAGDMRGQYKDYLSAVKSLNEVSAQADRSIGTMIANSQVYFADWGNQIAAINDPALKQLSADRKQQAVANLADLKTAMEKARAAYAPLAKDLNDVGLYLGNNLTADGIAAMKPRLDSIKVEAVGVRDALTGVVTALNKFSGTLATPAK
jgi:Protein of unknown function (DUF2959)